MQRVATLAIALAAEETYKPPRRNKKNQKCYQSGAVWRAFSDGDRRWNLCVLTKDRVSYSKMTTAKTGRPVKAYEAHHLFPRTLEREFAAAGILNVNLPGFLCWQPRDRHEGAKDRFNARWRTVLSRIETRSGRLRYSDRPELLRIATQFASGRRGKEFACRANVSLSTSNITG